MDELAVTRDIDLELTEEELWALVGDGRAWSEWMTDAADVDVVAGGGGEVVDDGVRRHVRVDDVVPGREVRFRWWPDDEPDVVSAVRLVVLPTPSGSTLRITETRALAAATVSAVTTLDLRWEVRVLALWSRCAARVRA